MAQKLEQISFKGTNPAVVAKKAVDFMEKWGDDIVVIAQTQFYDRICEDNVHIIFFYE